MKLSVIRHDNGHWYNRKSKTFFGSLFSPFFLIESGDISRIERECFPALANNETKSNRLSREGVCTHLVNTRSYEGEKIDKATDAGRCTKRCNWSRERDAVGSSLTTTCPLALAK